MSVVCAAHLEPTVKLLMYLDRRGFAATRCTATSCTILDDHFHTFYLCFHLLPWSSIPCPCPTFSQCTCQVQLKKANCICRWNGNSRNCVSYHGVLAATNSLKLFGVARHVYTGLLLFHAWCARLGSAIAYQRHVRTCIQRCVRTCIQRSYVDWRLLSPFIDEEPVILLWSMNSWTHFNLHSVDCSHWVTVKTLSEMMAYAIYSAGHVCKSIYSVK